MALKPAGSAESSGEHFGNDERVEALWAIKAYEHAEVYFNVSPRVTILRI